MIKKITLVTIGISALLLSGCDGSSESSSSATMIVENKTEHKAFQLYVRDAGSYSWGGDMLPSDKYIRANTIVEFETTSCDKQIDIKVTGFLGDPVWLFENKKLSCGLSKTLLLTY